jgi:hypothetical protein
MMLSPFRFAVIVTVILAVSGAATAEQLAPAGSGVTIQKTVIENGPAHTVKYFVKGGSPKLQGLVRRVEWAENELSVIEQMQQLKLDTVVNERSIAAFRTAQLTNPYYPPGFIPPAIAPGYGSDYQSRLQKALTGQLAYEATPQAALQMIGYLEQMQSQLDAELKALPAQEKKAAQGPVDALRKKVAALAPGHVPPAPPQPVAQQHISFPGQAIPQQQSMPLDATAFQQMVRQLQDRVRQQFTQVRQQMALAR